MADVIDDARLTAVHEAGHAVAVGLLLGCNAIDVVSTAPRDERVGRSAGHVRNWGDDRATAWQYGTFGRRAGDPRSGRVARRMGHRAIAVLMLGPAAEWRADGYAPGEWVTEFWPVGCLNRLPGCPCDACRVDELAGHVARGSPHRRGVVIRRVAALVDELIELPWIWSAIVDLADRLPVDGTMDGADVAAYLAAEWSGEAGGAARLAATWNRRFAIGTF